MLKQKWNACDQQNMSSQDLDCDVSCHWIDRKRTDENGSKHNLRFCHDNSYHVIGNMFQVSQIKTMVMTKDENVDGK